MKTMAEVAVELRGARYLANANLPLPNVYWCSVDMPGHGQHHTHLASDHTIAAVKKMANFCAHHHGFRPMRSNSQLKVRRLKLGDLIENPDAHRIALDNARAAGERDIIAALEKLPAWIERHVKGLNQPQLAPHAANDSHVDTDAVWERLTLEINGLGLQASA